MIAPAVGVDQSVNSTTRLNLRSAFQEMQNASVFSFRYFGDPQLGGVYLSGTNNPPSVKHLATAGGIKRGSIQYHRWTRVDSNHPDHIRVELIQKRILIIKMLSHG
jgi:hypothetical protein